MFLAANFSAYGNNTRAWSHLKLAVDRLTKGTSVLLGQVTAAGESSPGAPGNSCTTAKENSKWSEWLENAITFAETSLAQENVIAVRFANGCPRLSPLKGYASFLVLWWYQSKHHIHEVEAAVEDASGLLPSINFQKLCPNDWKDIKAVQFLCASEQILTKTGATEVDECEGDVRAPQHGEPHIDPFQPSALPTPGGSLTPITEEPDSATEYLSLDMSSEDDLQEAITEANAYFYTIWRRPDRERPSC